MKNHLSLALLIIIAILWISGCTGSMNVTVSPHPTEISNATATPTLTPTPAGTPETEPVNVTPDPGLKNASTITPAPTATPVPSPSEIPGGNPVVTTTPTPSPSPTATPTPSPVPTGTIHFRAIPPPNQVLSPEWLDSVTVTIQGGPSYTGKSLYGVFSDQPHGNYTMSATITYKVTGNGNLTTYIYENSGRSFYFYPEDPYTWVYLGCSLVSCYNESL